MSRRKRYGDAMAWPHGCCPPNQSLPSDPEATFLSTTMIGKIPVLIATRRLLLILTLMAVAASPSRADLISEISGLSDSALNSLVAHFDGRRNVDTTGNVVNSWTPIDAFGNRLDNQIVTSSQRGNGAADLITYQASGVLRFDDTEVARDGRYLNGSLANAGTSELTVFWLGHYDANAPFANSGTYAFNIGSGDLAHQRDDRSGGYAIELFNGSTYGGDDIQAFDGVDTVWSTVVTANSHVAYADGINLNVTGSPTYNIDADANLNIGAFGSSGFDLVGDVRQLVIFESALNDSDRLLIENFLGSTAVPEPAVPGTLAVGFCGSLLVRRRQRRSGRIVL